ncbi:MAG: 50S ribosomal protein L25 [Bacteroidetes bacterium]|nr:50S ribosomal protein L25 [Bacteroidota bacterium]
MKQIALEAAPRQQTGKVYAKKLRNAGKIPAVVYTKEGAVHVEMEAREAEKVLLTPDTYVIDLKVGKESYKTVVNNASFHYLHDNVQDVEFRQISEARPVQVLLPIRLIGSSVGVLAGGKLVQKARKLRVRGVYSQLPEELVIDITSLRLGHSLKVRDLKYDNFVIAENSDVPIASVELTRSLRQEAATQGKGK